MRILGYLREHESTIGNRYSRVKTLPDDKVEAVVDFIHSLTTKGKMERLKILEETAACLSPEDTDAMEEAVKIARRIDADQW